MQTNFIINKMENINEKELIICIFDLDTLSIDKYKQIETLYIHDTKAVVVSQHVLKLVTLKTS